MGEWIKGFDGRLDVSPPLSDEQLGQVPARRGVFALLGEGDVPIVLLTGADIRARLRGRLSEPEQDGPRRKTVDLRAVTRAVLWKLAHSHFETDWRYLELARRIWPDAYAELLPYRPAWFVHVNPGEQFPYFARTRDAGAEEGLYVGPFADGRSADRFIAGIQDAFNLCRDYRCLRQSPNAPRCSYAQMGRCLSPCDGTISMDAYRRVMGEAAAVAAGGRDAFREKLTARMKQSAGELAFERAAAIKLRLERLAELDRLARAAAEPLEAFRYILVQQGGSTRRASVFLARQGEIHAAGSLEYPLKPAQLRRVLSRMESLDARAVKRDAAYAWRLGLVASYLFCGAARRGVAMRWRAETTEDHLADAIESAASHLKLRAPKPRKKKASKQADKGADRKT